MKTADTSGTVANTRSEKREVTIFAVALRTGLMATGGLLMYFLAMRALGLLYITELRALNFFILLPGVIYSINCLKKNRVLDFGYFEGLAVGFLTSCIASVSFGLFVFFYLWQIDPAFMQYLRENAIFGQYHTPGLSAFAILMEGIASGGIMSFAAMQYFKRFTK